MERPVPLNLVMDISLTLTDQNLVCFLKKLPSEITHILHSKISPFHSAQFYIRTGKLLKYDFEDFRVFCVKNKVHNSYNLEYNWILTFNKFMQERTGSNASNEFSLKEYLNNRVFDPTRSVFLKTHVYVKDNQTFVYGTDLFQLHDNEMYPCILEIGCLNDMAVEPDPVSRTVMIYEPFYNSSFVREIDIDVNGLFYFLLVSTNGTTIACKDLSSGESATEVFSVNHRPVIEEHEDKQGMLAVDGDHIFFFLSKFNTLHYFNKSTREHVERQVDGDLEITEKIYALGPNAIIFYAYGFRIVSFQNGTPRITRYGYPTISLPCMMNRSILYKDENEPIVDGNNHLKVAYLVGDELVSRNLLSCHRHSTVFITSTQLIRIDDSANDQTSKYFLEAPEVEPILFDVRESKRRYSI